MVEKGLCKNEKGTIDPILAEGQHRRISGIGLDPSTSFPSPSAKDQVHTSSDHQDTTHI